MPYKLLLLTLSAMALLASVSSPGRAAATHFQLQNATVDGIVVGPDRRPIDRVVVRIYDEAGVREAGRAYTNSSGRFSVTVAPGRYVVEADPITEPTLAKQRQEIEILQGPGLGGSPRVAISFQLKTMVAAVPKPTGPRFDQEVPPQAKAEYDRAVQVFGTNREEALEALRKALQMYPEYYDALELLGTEYVKDGHFDHAMIVLMKAVEVNPKGERSHYGLGVVYYRKGRFDLAIEALGRALAIVPDDANALLYLGLAQLRAGKPAEAEPSLKRAYDLGVKGVVDLHLALTKIYSESNRKREAANQLKLLLREQPDYKDAQKIRELIQRLESKS